MAGNVLDENIGDPAACAALFRGLWGAASQSMFIASPLAEGEFALEAVNPALEAALGRAGPDLAHRPLAEIFPQEHAARLGERLGQCLTSGEPLGFEEERSLDPSRPRWWSTLLVPQPGEEGETARIFGVSQELTELYETYAELSRANAQARRGSVERGQELEATKERLERVEQLARVDELTNIWNRRYLYEIAPALMERCRRDGRPLAGIMMDADHFKLLNDQYGHQAGDDALARMATTIRGNLRAADTVGRYGGEEFLALLPGADASAAELVAERIRSAVAAEPGSPSLCMSVGVAAVDPAAEGLEGLIRWADDALLQAKQAGRNRVVTAQPPFASLCAI